MQSQSRVVQSRIKLGLELELELELERRRYTDRIRLELDAADLNDADILVDLMQVY